MLQAWANDRKRTCVCVCVRRETSSRPRLAFSIDNLPLQLHLETGGAHAPGQLRLVLAPVQRTKPPVMMRRWKSNSHVPATV